MIAIKPDVKEKKESLAFHPVVVLYLSPNITMYNRSKKKIRSTNTKAHHIQTFNKLIEQNTHKNNNEMHSTIL